jgi:hypothetical protein
MFLTQKIAQTVNITKQHNDKQQKPSKSDIKRHLHN